MYGSSVRGELLKVPAVLARQVFRVDGNKFTEKEFLIVLSRRYVSANLFRKRERTIYSSYFQWKR